MKRIIKFRGKSKRTGEWLYGDLEYNKKEGIARIHTYDSEGNYEGQEIVDEETIGQFTGLLDKNGTEIYEGDIVTLSDITKEKASVIWLDKKARFVVKCVSDKQTYSIDEHNAILGNIYDNPELFKR